MNAYTARVLEDLKARNAHESEFIQAATEILESLSPVLTSIPNTKPPACWSASSSPSA